ncbi:hypothetical protein VTL71DRAFT_13977 [Oculimacula yallundae]|uniref:Amidohydrolase-related domain-containing protein n=1 Tax=Oculimacula yallundae TaxID=86028 RepID=A0ABR4CP04_9HELO
MFLQILLICTSLVQIVSTGCSGHHHHIGPADHFKTAITNVLVWDGQKFPRSRSTVVFIDGVIADSNPVGAAVINGNGGYLIPGLIDSHVRISDCSQLKALQKFGVTTALDLGHYPYDPVKKCGEHGVTDLASSGALGIVEGVPIGYCPAYPSPLLLPAIEAGEESVAAHVAAGVDYITLFLSPVGPDDATIREVIKAAHKEGLQVIAHAATYDLYAQAARTGVDVAIGVPYDIGLDGAVIDSITSSKMKVVPSLFRINSDIQREPEFMYQNSMQSIRSLLEAGNPVAAGSSSNDDADLLSALPFGESLHMELAMFVKAGLTPNQAIQAATSIPASIFGMHDRGAIKPGMRADLILLSADPTADIGNTRKIVKVWVEGLSK